MQNLGDKHSALWELENRECKYNFIRGFGNDELKNILGNLNILFHLELSSLAIFPIITLLAYNFGLILEFCCL